MKKIIISVSILIALCCMNFVPTYAGAPTCHTHNGTPYCSYSGKVSRAYINAGNLILIYFDTPMDPAQASSVGLSVTSGTAAAAFVLTEENKLFGNALYATALAALNADKNISIHMRGNYGGYLKIDRIWIVK